MSRTILVHKYGGTSVGSTERLHAVADRLAQCVADGHRLVVVVSAMGSTTDQLAQLAQSMRVTDVPEAFQSASSREYDQLVATGEIVSASLLAMAVHARGCSAVSLTGGQAGIQTEMMYSRAKILGVDLTRIHQELASHSVVIVTGFQGVNKRNDVTTIGRGGSDTSAVVLAAALNVAVCDIYTDVDGVYTSDPRSIRGVSKLPMVSYDDMLELASLGARVLHPRAVECAKINGIELHVRSSFSNESGTRVKEIGMEVQQPVTGVTVNEDEVLFALRGLPDIPGIAAQVFGALAAANISVDMIVQSTQDKGTNTITFTVSQSDTQSAKAIAVSISDSLKGVSVIEHTQIAKVSVVGVGMISRPGVAATVFDVLGKAGMNIHLISTSEIKISCAIDRDQGGAAAQLLHDAFQLDQL
ncbi:MAG: aspartate kinase [Candidatus Marinamargulisbacteria bacterium]|nr:aspartate kinase [Candidatus Marinamargulisbacteria bacterium]